MSASGNQSPVISLIQKTVIIAVGLIAIIGLYFVYKSFIQPQLSSSESQPLSSITQQTSECNQPITFYNTDEAVTFNLNKNQLANFLDDINFWGNQVPTTLAASANFIPPKCLYIIYTDRETVLNNGYMVNHVVSRDENDKLVQQRLASVDVADSGAVTVYTAIFMENKPQDTVELVSDFTLMRTLYFIANFQTSGSDPTADNEQLNTAYRSYGGSISTLQE